MQGGSGTTTALHLLSEPLDYIYDNNVVLAGHIRPTLSLVNYNIIVYKLN